MKFKTLLLNFIPSNSLRNRVRCLYYNIKKAPFTLSFVNGYFVATYSEFIIRFVQNPYYLLRSQEAYFKHYLPNKGDIVIDAGAFWGTVAIYMSKLVGRTGRVIVYEPDNDNCDVLLKNISINDISNIEVVRAGLWSRNCILPFNQDGSLGSSFVLEDTQTTVGVKVVALNDEIERLNLRRVDFVKMDIEGAELEVIDGAAQLMSEGNTYFAIASYHIVNGEPTSKELERKFVSMGYDAFTEKGVESITYAQKRLA
jgi:FkbM family methyltransferase